MARFLLIHGSCHGAWCWRDLLPLLNSRGHAARAIDLPAHGQDETPVAEVTLGSYVAAIEAAIDPPVILVGHSLAGLAISAAAEHMPEKIARLVYLCAWLPKDGQSAMDARKAALRQPLLEALITAPDRLSTRFRPEMLREKFYHDCPDETVEFARKNLCPEPTAPSNTPVKLGANYASVARSYIRCTEDCAIPPEHQLTMSQTLPARDTYEMACAHSPFFAQPARLAQILFQIAEA